MGKYSPWEPTATLPFAGAAIGSVAQSASMPTEGGEGLGNIVVAARLQLVFVVPSSVQLLFAVKAMNYVRARHTAWNSGYSIRFFYKNCICTILRFYP